MIITEWRWEWEWRGVSMRSEWRYDTKLTAITDWDVQMILKRYMTMFGLVATVLLSGCARMDDVMGSKHFCVKSPVERQAELATINTWRIDGAFSIKQPGQKTEIADYIWNQQSRKDYRIRITSPLNLYFIQIYHEYGSVTLWKNTTHVSTAKTPEGLMQKAIGWSLPVSELSMWLKGMPAQNAGPYHAEYDEYGHLILLEQSGWVLHYCVYKRYHKDLDFPRVLTMKRPGFSVKIVTRDWFLPLYHPEVNVVG